MLKTTLNVLVMVGLVAFSSAACATKSFVAESIDKRAAVVDQRITAVEQAVDQTAEDTRANTARLGEVDATATTALDTAGEAVDSARGARTTAIEAAMRASALEALNRQLLFEVVLSEDHGQFAFADTALPAEAMASLDTLVDRLRGQRTGVHVEIEGHTDQTGSAEYNKRLGLERADTVRRYLHEQHKLPLHKINIISYGEEKPVAPNDTTDGRAKNRRVVVRVLAADDPGRASTAGNDQ